ncbi:MAG TPA: GMC oxidoreductase [Microlunatus sp.]
MRFDYYNDLMFFNGSSWDRYFPARFDEKVQYDVIVIGSGTGGGILANAASNLGLMTLVLEAGPVRHLVNITDLPLPNVLESMDPYEQTEGTDLRGGVCFNLGGRSVFWSAVIPRMKPWELAHWPAAVAEHLVDGGYASAERLFRKRHDHPPFQVDLEARVRARFGADYEVTQLPRSYHQPDSEQNPRDGSPDERTTGVFSTAALLSSALLNGRKAGVDNLHVAVQHLVDRVILGQPLQNGLRKASAVEALDLRAGVRRVFQGRFVVLAGGTTESARLAMTSGVHDESGMLGRGLTDHAEAELPFEVARDCTFFDADSQGNLLLRPRDQGDDGFSCELALNWKFWDVRIEDDYWYKKNLDQDEPIRSTIKFLFRSPLRNDNQLFVEGSKYYVDIAPTSEPPEDLRARASALGGELQELFGVTNPDPNLRYQPYALTYHLAGSMRMSEDPNDGVVDTDLRFHQYDNLYCCDLSVFPDVPASNPSLTLGSLAQRLAVELKSRCV